MINGHFPLHLVRPAVRSSVPAAPGLSAGSPSPTSPTGGAQHRRPNASWSIEPPDVADVRGSSSTTFAALPATPDGTTGGRPVQFAGGTVVGWATCGREAGFGIAPIAASADFSRL